MMSDFKAKNAPNSLSAYGVLPQTPLEEPIALPSCLLAPLAVFKGSMSKRREKEGSGEELRRGKKCKGEVRGDEVEGGPEGFSLPKNLRGTPMSDP